MIQEDLENLSSWFKANKLSLNIQKTTAMLFLPKKSTYKYTNLPLQIDNEPLPVVSQTKFLGVIIDNQLTWKEHVNNIIWKISINKTLIGKSLNLMNTSAKRKIYYTHICDVRHAGEGCVAPVAIRFRRCRLVQPEQCSRAPTKRR